MSQLGRLRRVLPLASRLAQAPGACSHYSDLASSVPGRGRGGGGPAGEGGSQAPGSSSSRQLERAPRQRSAGEASPTNDSRFADPEEPHARVAAGPSRGPAAQQQQQQQQQQPGRRGARRRGGGAAGGRMARLAAGSDDEESSEEDDAELQELERGAARGERRVGESSDAADEELKRVLLTGFEVDFPHPEQEGKTVPVPVAELIPEDALGLDPSRLWLLKYVVGPEALARLQAGAMDTEEMEEVIDKIEATVLPSGPEIERQTTQYMQINWDPDYRLLDAAGSTPSVDPAAGKADKKLPRAEAVLDAFKEGLMAMLDMGEEEFELAKAEVAAEYTREVRHNVRSQLPRDYEDRMYALLEKSVPRDHPMYGAIKSKLQVLACNPQWPGPRKIIFAKRLIKTLSTA